jgi:hypothetical protein
MEGGGKSLLPQLHYIASFIRNADHILLFAWHVMLCQGSGEACALAVSATCSRIPRNFSECPKRGDLRHCVPDGLFTAEQPHMNALLLTTGLRSFLIGTRLDLWSSNPLHFHHNDTGQGRGPKHFFDIDEHGELCCSIGCARPQATHFDRHSCAWSW